MTNPHNDPTRTPPAGGWDAALNRFDATLRQAEQLLAGEDVDGELPDGPDVGSDLGEPDAAQAERYAKLQARFEQLQAALVSEMETTSEVLGRTDTVKTAARRYVENDGRK